MEEIENYKLKLEELMNQHQNHNENMAEEIEIKETKKPKKTQKQIFVLDKKKST
tara:strand:+ start:382 stop:543 length:162 start_codon:yes stop_codon:yes gene_type:complete